ncbi:MAG TPA: cellulase family glycosylhydrolase [Thermoleophilaceae bacterium]|nr:cellulase family glycosylhydrolase [Thermoleophilaceae bacterium]
MATARRRLPAAAALLVAAVVSAMLSAGAWATGPGHDRADRGPVPPLTGDGRWLIDARGRVVVLHGVNEVTKRPPWHAAGAGFGRDDAQFISEHGFNVVRLGVEFLALMPEPGVVDQAYVEALAGVVRDLRREDLFVLLDFHQDGYGPKYGDNGFPEWMSLDDGIPNTNDPFPFYYILNAALQRAFENFWANAPGPGGIGLQDYYVQGLRAVVKRFAGDRSVLGYELLNEPWPGADFAPCFSGAGCPDIERSRLVPFYRKATAVVRRITRTQQVFVEPFSTFNFGLGPTTIPGSGSGNGLSTHGYAGGASAERFLAESITAAERDGAPLIVTEFGATTDATALRRNVGGFDQRGLSWIFWAYNENIIRDRTVPASLDALQSRPAFEALVEPYPQALTGVPSSSRFDPATRTYELAYVARSPGGRRYPPWLPSIVWVPRLQYADGYRVEVSGAVVTSRPCAERLKLRTRLFARSVTVRVTPGGPCR